jgi:lipid II:glycine glycyltransferase (peptidoglycan interpeptide bridge formation enzyme)
LFTEIRHQVDGSQFRETLCELSFNYEDHVNYLVDLALPIDKIWTNISKSTRKNIQKMLKNDLFVIEEIREVEKVKIWYQLMKNSFARLGVPLADYSLFETAFEILYPKGMIQFLLGKVQGEYMAASVALLYKDLIYGWYRGFNRDFSEFSPNEAMVWHLLKWGSENGFRYFDFGGAGNPHKEYGPRAFKQKFGGNLVNYGRSTFVHGPFRLKISQIGYKLFRNFL